MHYRFEDSDRVYVTATEPGNFGPCVVRPDDGRRGHPSYKVVSRSIPPSAEAFKAGPTIKKILKGNN